MTNYDYLYTMSKDRIIEILEDKLQHQNRIILQFSDTLSTQSDTIKQLTHQISILQQSLVSLEEALLEKNSNIEKLLNQNRGLGKLISNKSEKQTAHKQPVISNNQTDEFGADILEVEKSPRKGNNNAKRKEFYNLDVEYKHIFPSQIGFDPKNYNDISTT